MRPRNTHSEQGSSFRENISPKVLVPRGDTLPPFPHPGPDRFQLDRLGMPLPHSTPSSQPLRPVAPSNQERTCKSSKCSRPERGARCQRDKDTSKLPNCGVIAGLLKRGSLCGGAEPAAALPSPGLSGSQGAGRPRSRAPRRIINRPSESGTKAPIHPAVPTLPGILLLRGENCSQLGRRATSALWENRGEETRS